MTPRHFADGAAIGISTLCLLHCLAVPTFLAVAPWLVPGFMEDERFHVLAVLTAIPVSILAMASSLRARPLIVATAAVGLLFLFAGTLFEDELLETSLTVTGAILVAVAHVQNLLHRSSSETGVA